MQPTLKANRWHIK